MRLAGHECLSLHYCLLSLGKDHIDYCWFDTTRSIIQACDCAVVDTATVLCFQHVGRASLCLSSLLHSLPKDWTGMHNSEH